VCQTSARQLQSTEPGTLGRETASASLPPPSPASSTGQGDLGTGGTQKHSSTGASTSSVVGEKDQEEFLNKNGFHKNGGLTP